MGHAKTAVLLLFSNESCSHITVTSFVVKNSFSVGLQVWVRSLGLQGVEKYFNLCRKCPNLNAFNAKDDWESTRRDTLLVLLSHCRSLNLAKAEFAVSLKLLTPGFEN